MQNYKMDCLTFENNSGFYFTKRNKITKATDLYRFCFQGVNNS
jgi:hypothetical protein